MIQVVADAEVREETEYIDSDSFTPTGEKLGLGCWGKVDEYADTVGQKWALKMFHPNEDGKRQMKEGGWTEEDVMRREAVPLGAAYRHVVPRIIERDKTRKMFVAMPVYNRNLSKDIGCMDLESALKVTRDIADAISYTHEQKELSEIGFEIPKAHGDVKPTNVLMKDGRAFLTDFGSSTCISIGGHGSERGPHGDEDYKAPECFREDAKPSTRADIWSLGAILYESITNQGIYNKGAR